VVVLDEIQFHALPAQDIVAKCFGKEATMVAEFRWGDNEQAVYFQMLDLHLMLLKTLQNAPIAWLSRECTPGPGHRLAAE
jgi:hypothetical protein